MKRNLLSFVGAGFITLPLSAHEVISPHSHSEYVPVGLGTLLFTTALIATYSLWRKYRTNKQ